MDSTFWLNLGIGGAVVFVVRMFLNHLKQERRACEHCRSQQNEVAKTFGDIIANHMRHEVEARERLTQAIRSLETLFRDGVTSPPDLVRKEPGPPR